MCSKFDDDGVRCESCAAKHETAQLVQARAEKLRQPAKPAIVEESLDIESFGPRKQGRSYRWLLQLGVVLLLLAVGIPLYFYAYPKIELEDSPVRAREEQISGLMQCLLVFRQLGEQMQSGLEPDMSLQCASPSGPNILRRNDTVIRILHPNPQLYGVQEISVSNASPEPVIVQP